MMQRTATWRLGLLLAAACSASGCLPLIPVFVAANRKRDEASGRTKRERETAELAREVKRNLRLLSGSDRGGREKAVRELRKLTRFDAGRLGRLRNHVLRGFSAALADGENSVATRVDAARGIGRLEDVGGKGALLAALAGDESPEVRAAAAEGLSELVKGKDARAGVGPLAAALGDPSPVVKRAALAALDKLLRTGAGHGMAVPRAPVREFLSDPAPEVRERATLVLARLGEMDVGRLLAFLEGRDAEFAREAKELLEAARGAEAGEAVRGLLRIEDPYGKKGLSAVLRKLAPKATGALEDALRGDEDPNARSKAFELLLETKRDGDERVGFLVPWLDSGDFALKYRALRELKYLRWRPVRPEHQMLMLIHEGKYSEAAKLGASAADPLIAALWTGADRDRARAAVALGELGDDRAVEPLRLALSSADPGLRGCAAVALGRFGRKAESAVEALIDSFPVIRGTIVQREFFESAVFDDSESHSPPPGIERDILAKIGAAPGGERYVIVGRTEKSLQIEGAPLRITLHNMGVENKRRDATLVTSVEYGFYAGGAALQAITGQDLGILEDRWREWWKSRQRSGGE